MKAYKGFNKDMTCRDFQYEEGKEYTTEKAKLCEEGFHACEDPIDCLRYYDPANSEFHEVEIHDNGEKSDDSKIVGTKIKIGAKIDVPLIAKAHFEFIKEKCVSSDTSGDSSALTGGDSSALTGGDSSALTGGDSSALTGGDSSALTGGNRSALTGDDCSALTGGYCSALTGGNRSALTGDDCSALTGGDRSALAGGDSSALTGGNNSVVYGNGKYAKVRGGIGAVLVLAEYDENYNFVKNHVRSVDGIKIKANTYYTLKNSRWIEVK
ncbi:MAG: DUF7666 domain-containing protein [Candidatus Fimenecus sp.]